jgi:precorrin-2 dehydrogenase / sirohydrochlorin ferrochelatase
MVNGVKSNRQLLPLFLDLGSRSVVIFGGGSVGERKARLFSEFSRVTVVSKGFTEAILQMERAGSAKLIRADLAQGYHEYLEGAFMVIPATSDAELNRSIEIAASKKGILVNKVDGIGDVVVPSLIRKGPIAIAISTKSPALSKYLRLRLERELDENFEGMARLLGQIREEIKQEVPDQVERSRIIWSILSDREVWELLDLSYEKAYMRAREQVPQHERDSLDAGDPPQGIDRRD